MNIQSYVGIILLAFSFSHVYAEETRTYSQPPVITGEFLVEQEDQKPFATLPKDSDQIVIENDFLGIKKFAKETFNTRKIEERYKKGLEKLQEDKSTHVVDP